MPHKHPRKSLTKKNYQLKNIIKNKKKMVEFRSVCVFICTCFFFLFVLLSIPWSLLLLPPLIFFFLFCFSLFLVLPNLVWCGSSASDGPMWDQRCLHVVGQFFGWVHSLWCGFPGKFEAQLRLNVNPLPSHFLISLSQSWDWIWSQSWVCCICFGFLTNLGRDIMSSWNEIFLGLSIRGFVGFVKNV